MSSIDPLQARPLERFYDSYLRPLAQAPGHQAAAEPWPPSDTASSYFIKRRHTRLRREEFELPLGDPDQAASTLEKAWAGTRLRGLAKPLMKLAPAFRDVEERAEVSPFVYEMF